MLELFKENDGITNDLDTLFSCIPDEISSVLTNDPRKNDLIEIRDSNIFETSPFALLEVFLLLQQHPNLKGIGVDTIRSIRENLFRIDAGFRQDLRCRTLFMEILRAPLGQTRALRQMNAYGILGAYIPQFGRIVGQMQHDLFHVYTVDQHLLFVIRNLRRLELSEHDAEYPAESKLMRTIFKRHRLFIAALFHDISKGQGGDHSKLGESEAFQFCRRHNLSDYDCHFVSWLVRHHLTMSWIAQREDTSDVGVIDDFARLVGDQERLDNLYLLTVADIRGTSPDVWNDWKGKLLSDLYNLTTQALRRDVGSPLLPSEFSTPSTLSSPLPSSGFSVGFSIENTLQKWMETVKLVFGFIELAAAVKFLWVPDLEWNLDFLPRNVVLAIFILIGIAQMAYLIDLLKAKEDPINGGTLFDHTMILFGCGMATGTHSCKNMPLVLAGGGFTLGEHVVLPEGKFERVKACNLLLSMLQNVGSEVDRFGTSTATLAGLEWKSA